MRLQPLSLLLLALILLLPGTARSVDPDDLLPIDQAFELTARAEAGRGVVFSFRIAEGYYLYRHRMGAESSDGRFRAGELELPPGEAYTDEFFGDVETYRDLVEMVLTGSPAAGSGQASFTVRYQGCADIGVCYPPHRKTLSVALPAAASLPQTGIPGIPLTSTLGLKPSGLGIAGPNLPVVDALPLPEEEAFGFEAIATSGNELLLRFTPAPGYYVYQDRSAFRIVEGEGVGLGAPRWPTATPHADEHFGEVLVYFGQVELPISVGRRSGEAQRIVLEVTFQGCQDEGICYPPMTRRVAIDLPAGEAVAIEETPPPPAASLSFLALLAALGGALIGGLILNLMPCVLPILSLKALGLASSGESREKARAHALWYTAGVLATFAAVGLGVIALRAAGEALGWGFQLQQPIFVAALVYVMLAIGLSLSGVFTLGAGVAGLGQNLTQKSGPAGDFFTGVLAVVVASPCTAPFMGTALAFAFAAPTALALAVFLALGLGLALPFLLIGFVPAFARMLPRPGAWMDGFKQAMAFPMYLTAVWLVWVLGKQRGIDAVGLLLIGAVLLAAALWWLERLRHQFRPIARVLAFALMLLALLPLWGVGRLEAPAAASVDGVAADGSVAYSAERLDALRADGRAVFVNMTADWCVTCKANERRVLAGEAFRAALTLTDTVYMKGDWTNVDPAITAFLQQHGAVGVPLYVVYPPGGGAPRVLPLVLSEAMVLEALGVNP